MALMGFLHILGNKTNNKRNIWMGIIQIQKYTDFLMVESGINFMSSIGGSKFDSRLEGIRG
jgi:hypothetical protein